MHDAGIGDRGRFGYFMQVVDKIQYTKVDAVTTASTLIDLIEWDDKYEVVVLYADTNTFTPSELSLLVKQFNLIAMKKDVVALEDHPLDEEIVNGVHMNFGKAILILVQRLSKLNNASKHLDKQGTIHNLKMTRFELTSKGFIIWAEYSIDNKNITSEFNLSNSKITHIQTQEA